MSTCLWADIFEYNIFCYIRERYLVKIFASNNATVVAVRFYIGVDNEAGF